MKTKNKFIREKGVNQASINPFEAKDTHKNRVAPSTDYFTDWTTEKFFNEKPKAKKIGNSAEPMSGDSQTSYNDQYY
ncbi:MAG: hypothetical protein Q7U54_19165 [Bacteroidales bacterium]|nr:hypothetical protein [Bacteroidales bacterium]